MNDEENIARLGQKCFASNPVIVLGSGASYPHGLPGMNELKEHLLANVSPDEGKESDEWLLVRTALAEGDHLEQALAGRTLPQSLIEQIVIETWKCISTADYKLFLRVATGETRLPLTDLFAGLARSSNSTINVVTPNYDRVVEYAGETAELFCTSGFSPGYIGSREGAQKLRLQKGGREGKQIKIWKVHGSLDWFARKDETVFSAPGMINLVEGLTPLIVTPGVSKYERTYSEPFRSAIQGADQSLSEAEAYLCIGYGFRDSHIEPKLVERCKQKNIPITIITKQLTDEAKAFLANSAGKEYLAIEAVENGSRAYTSAKPEGIAIPHRDLWSLPGFLQLVM